MSNQIQIVNLPNNPDWSKAPEWGNYWAIDKINHAYWHENEPTTAHDAWWNTGRIRFDKDYNSATFFCENWENSVQQRPKIETLVTSHTTDISGYLAGKNSFTTGLVDLLLARMAKEERFSDGDPRDLSMSPIALDVCKIYYPGLGGHYCVVLSKRQSKRGTVAECLGINGENKESWGFSIVMGEWLESPESGWIRTITELEAVEFRQVMEATYG